jgi:hypothetical protein
MVEAELEQIRTLHAQGKLSQKCPDCGLVEAAGSYCTSCYAMTSENDWYRPKASEAQLRSLRRPRGLRGTTTAKSPTLPKT